MVKKLLLLTIPLVAMFLSINCGNKDKSVSADTVTQWTAIRESDYKLYKYYFLDTAYISYYNRCAHSGWQVNSLPQSLKVKDLQVWLMVPTDQQIVEIMRSDPGRPIHRFHYHDPSSDPSDGPTSKTFVLLYKDQHYTLDPDLGYIRFSDSVIICDQDMIGIYLRTYGDLKKGGDIPPPPDSAFPDSLWILKDYMISNYADYLNYYPERFPLMWRNVYAIPADIDDLSAFRIRVGAITLDGYDTTWTVANGGTRISDILGLTKNGTILSQSAIYDYNDREIIIPSFDSTKYGNQPFANPLLRGSNGTDMRDTMIYRYGLNTDIMQNSYNPTFIIQMGCAGK